MKVVWLLFLISLLSGCATVDREVSLKIPEHQVGPRAYGNAFLGDIISDRVFSQHQKDASKPSYNGYLREAKSSDLNNVVGRFVSPINDEKLSVIRLQNKTSILSVTEDLIISGLLRHGYAPSNKDNSLYQVNVTVKEFWAWNEDGQVTFDLKSIIRCDVTVSTLGQSTTFSVVGRGNKKAMVASTGNWADSYQRATEDFLEHFNTALKKNM